MEQKFFKKWVQIFHLVIKFLMCMQCNLGTHTYIVWWYVGYFVISEH